MKDLNLGEELILEVCCRVSLQGSLLTFMNRLRTLLIQLFLEADKYLEELTFGGEPCLRLVVGRGRSGRLLFADVLDVNVWTGRRVDGPRGPNSH